MGVGASLVKKRVRNGRTRWVIDFYYSNNRGERARFVRYADLQSRDGAEREARQYHERAVLTGSPLHERRSGMTLATFYEATFKPNVLPLYRKNTRTRYEALWRQRVSTAFGTKRLDEIDEDDLRAFGRSVEFEGRQPKGPVTFTRTLLREAEKAGLIKKAPSLPPGVLKAAKKLPDAPTLAAVEKLITHASGWLKLALVLGVYAGLRSGELRALRVGDVSLEEGLIRIKRTLSEDEEETPKGDKERTVPIVAPLASILAEAMLGKATDERLVVTDKGTTPRRQHVLTRLVSLQRSIGASRVWSVHALHHAFCSHLVRIGTGVETVRALAGHSSIGVTNRYVHATATDLRGAMDRGFPSVVAGR